MSQDRILRISSAFLKHSLNQLVGIFENICRRIISKNKTGLDFQGYIFGSNKIFLEYFLELFS